MQVLVTGANGNLGNYVCEELVRGGHVVRAMTHYNTHNITRLRNKVEIVKADIRFQDECREAADGCDGIIHLAACIHVDRSRHHPLLFYETNVRGTMNMLEACRREDAKFVHMSTCEVLGNIPEGKADEGYSVKHPCSPYGSSKHAAESYCYAYHETYGLPINIVRGFNLFGPRQKPGGKGAVIPIFIEQVLRGQPPTIYGSGEQTRDYVDVRDVSRGIRSVLESEYRGELFHLCTGVETSINTLAEKVIAACNAEMVPVHVDGRPGELMRSVGDYSKAKRMLGWGPQLSFDETLREVVEYLSS